MADPKRMTERDLMVAIYESISASRDQAKEDSKRSQYLLIAVLGGLGAREFIHTDPLVVISFMFGVVASVFALMVAIRGRHVVPFTSIVLLLSITVALIVGLITNLGVDGHLFPFFALTRMGVACALLFYALKVPTGPPPEAEAEEEEL